MKKSLMLFIVITISMASYAQDVDNLLGVSKEEEVKDEKKSTKNNGDVNLLDAQIDVYKTLFAGETIEGIDFDNVDGFLDLVEKTDFTPEQKLEFREMYFSQTNQPHRKAGDSIGQVLYKKMLEAEKEANNKH